MMKFINLVIKNNDKILELIWFSIVLIYVVLKKKIFFIRGNIENDVF